MGLTLSCSVSWDSVYPFAMLGHTGELKTREKLTCGMKSETTNLWTCDKIIFRTGIPSYYIHKQKKIDKF